MALPEEDPPKTLEELLVENIETLKSRDTILLQKQELIVLIDDIIKWLRNAPLINRLQELRRDLSGG